MSEDQKVPDRNHALNVLAADLSELFGWLNLTTRYTAAHEALAVVERELGLPVGEDLFPRRGPQLAAAQPPPEVPVGAEVAEVLAGLRADLEALRHRDYLTEAGVLDAIALVEAAQRQAATGTGACGDVLPGEFGGPDNVCTKPAGPHEWHQQGDGVRWNASGSWGSSKAQAATGARAAGGEGWSREKLLDYLDAAHGLICNAHRAKVDYVTEEDGASPGWAEAARRWIDAYPPPPAAPPTPSAPGVAELLAECDVIWMGGQDFVAVPLEAAQRLLSPGGADGEGT